ncbi:hypothetical protein TNCV_4991841 [Trichonephila clavipes]|nr:hypothetical protein TNCV_4991841 [Trichonephila clavipes]
MTHKFSSGSSSLVVKVTDMWLVCHEFKPSTVEEPPCREEGCCSLNLSKLKPPPVGVEVRKGNAISGVVLIT